MITFARKFAAPRGRQHRKQRPQRQAGAKYRANVEPNRSDTRHPPPKTAPVRPKKRTPRVALLKRLFCDAMCSYRRCYVLSQLKVFRYHPVYLEADSGSGRTWPARLGLFDSEELAARAVYEQAASHC